MSTSDFTTILQVDQTPEEAFNAINNVRGWWGETVEGDTHQLHDEFIYRHKDLHYSKHRIMELIPNKKVVWLVTDSQLSFTDKKDEWTGTHIIFDINQENGKTTIRFTHEGLVPQTECFSACSNGWSYYLHNSLLKLITSGKGQPDKREDMIKMKVENING